MNVQVFTPKFNQFIDSGNVLETVVTGFEFTEGSIWHPVEQSLIFNDILGNAIYHWTEVQGLKKLRRNSHMANGNTYDRQGRVLTCEHATSRVTRTDFAHAGEMEVLATHYQGRELNSPNDIICGQDGMIYFTDPAFGRLESVGVPREQELDFQGIYRLDPDSGSLTVLVRDFAKPNGLCFSLDEKYMYINDSAHNHIRLFEVTGEGTLSNDRLWAELSPAGKGVADGIKVDQAGNIFCCGPGGIHLFDADAVYLGIILMPEQSANLTWGGEDYRTLYITASTSVYRLQTRIPGHPTFRVD